MLESPIMSGRRRTIGQEAVAETSAHPSRDNTTVIVRKKSSGHPKRSVIHLLEIILRLS